MSNMHRKPAGAPDGGQFSANENSDPSTPLEPSTAAWPGLEWEQHDWTPAAGWGLSAARRESLTETYEAAVVPFIGELTPRVDDDTAQLADEAAQELSRCDAELGARVSSFAPVLLRSEAASSSQIENLTASARAVFSAELGAKSGRNAEQIAANTRAMQAALDLAEEPTTGSVLKMHEVLMAGQERHTPGRFREEAVWIGTSAESPRGASYVAPYFTDVAPLVDDLMSFARRADVPALTWVSVAHAQFETIHPFTDGNGRTGRALAQSLLRRRGVTRNVAVPVSAGLLADVAGYHQALTAYREGDVTPIVRAFSLASLRAVGNARQLVADIDIARAGWEQSLTVRKSSKAWELLDVVTRRPVLNAVTAAEELGVDRTNVYPALRALTDAGILKSKTEHQMGPFWRSDDVLHAIDRFAARAGRREA